MIPHRSAALPQSARTPTRPALHVPERHTIPRSIALHLLPGVAVTAAVLLAARLTNPVIAPVLAFALVLVPLELGSLLVLGKRITGRFTIAPVIPYRQPLPRGRFLLVTLGVLLACIVLFLVLGPVGAFMRSTVFAWLPGVLVAEPSLAGYSRAALLVLFLLELVITGIAAPVAEEVYFRGYLLPRLSSLGWWAPLLNAALFALYHFDQPPQWPVIFLAVLPLTFAVFRTRNVGIGIAVHCALNVIFAVLTYLPPLLR